MKKEIHVMSEKEYRQYKKRIEKEEAKQLRKEYVWSKYLFTITIPLCVSFISFLIAFSSILNDFKSFVIFGIISAYSCSIWCISKNDKDKIEELTKK